MEKVLLAKDVAQWLNIDVQRVYELTRRKLIPHVKVGERQYRYLESNIEKWLHDGGNKDESISLGPVYSRESEEVR